MSIKINLYNKYIMSANVIKTNFNTTTYQTTTANYNIDLPTYINGNNTIPISGTKYYNGLFGNVMAGLVIDNADSVLGGNVIVSGDHYIGGNIQAYNGNITGNLYVGSTLSGPTITSINSSISTAASNANTALSTANTVNTSLYFFTQTAQNWTSNNSYNVSFPSSTLPSTTSVVSSTIPNKAVNDILYAPIAITNNSGDTVAHSWTNTSTHNSYFPTSTLPTSTSITVNSIVNKGMTDTLYAPIAITNNSGDTVAHNWTNTSTHNTYFPTSTLPTSTSITTSSIVNKGMTDTLYAPIAITNNSGDTVAHNWTNTSTHNTYFPTSTLPTSTSITVNSIVNKGMCDTLYAPISVTSSSPTAGDPVAHSWTNTNTYNSFFPTSSLPTSTSITTNSIINKGMTDTLYAPIAITNNSGDAVSHTWTNNNSYNNYFPTSTLPTSTSITVNSIVNKGMCDTLYAPISVTSSSPTAGDTYAHIWSNTNSYNSYFPTSTLPTSTSITTSSIINKGMTDTLYAPITITNNSMDSVSHAWTNTNTHNNYFPTSTLPTSTSITTSSIVNKGMMDTLYAPITVSNNSGDGSNHTWTGSNTFNSYLPTSTVTPSSGSQLITKTYSDTTYGIISGSNTWSGSNTFGSSGINVNGAISSNCGNYNQSMGSYACFANSLTATGTNNIGIGSTLLQALTTGSNNIAIGQSNLSLSIGSNNIAIGQSVLTNINALSHDNVAIGNYSINSAPPNSVSYCVAIGSNAGQYTIGTNNTMLGANTGQISSNSNNYSYSTCIGYGALSTASNQITVGRTTENVNIPGTLGITGAVTANSTLGVTGAITAGSISLTTSLPKLYATPSTSLSIGTSNTAIAFAVHSVMVNITTSDNINFVIHTAGYYEFKAQITFNSGSDYIAVQIVRTNNAGGIIGAATGPQQTLANMSVSCYGTVYCALNDNIVVYASGHVSDTTNTYVGNWNCFSINYLL